MWPSVLLTTLSEHRYKIGSGSESERTMTFYMEARVDGLEKREETPTELIEYYVHRDDFLTYRYALFGPRPKKFGPAELSVRPVEVSP